MRRRVVTALVAFAVVALAAAFALRALTADDGDDSGHDTGSGTAADDSSAEQSADEESESPTPSPLPVPSAAATSDPETDQDGAEWVEPFVVAESASLQKPDTPLILDEVATGDALEELTISAFEYSENGLVQVGRPVLVSAVVTDVDTSASPATAEISVCLDYSDVDVQTVDGASVKDPDAEQRVASDLTLTQTDGSWLVSDRTFPDKPSC